MRPFHSCFSWHDRSDVVVSSSDQLFFISFARSWAQNIKPAAAVSRLYACVLHEILIVCTTQVARVRTDPHSPNRFRVHGTVSNIPEFAAAFKCSPKAKVCLFSHRLVWLVTHTVYDLVEPTAGGEVYFLVVDDSWWMDDCITYQPNGWLFISRTPG